MSFLTDDPEKQRRQVRRWQQTQAESRKRYADKLRNRTPEPISSKSPNELPALIRQADYWSRLYVKLRDRFCVTESMECYGDLQGSHLFSVSTGIALRFDDRVIFAQCEFHNQYHDRNQLPLRNHFVSIYGLPLYYVLRDEHMAIKKWTPNQLKAIIEKFKAKVAKLKAEESNDY